MVDLTPQGQAILDEVYGQTALHIETLVKALSADEHQKLSEGLIVLRQMFEVAVQNEHTDPKIDRAPAR
jgi:DNA-binding MarR family transcriptional regulator